MCFVCGVNNPIGLHLDFWMDGEQVWTDFTPGREHQGYPGVMHGGLVATLLDESWAGQPLKQLDGHGQDGGAYRKPVPLGAVAHNHCTH